MTRRMTMSKAVGATIATIMFLLLLKLALIVGVIWVVCHFISKWW